MVEGGGRKGLPQSFLTRFTRVYVETMSLEDMNDITSAAFDKKLNLHMKPMIPSMIQFIVKINEETSVKKSYGRLGSPWEFNLRDLFRWCEMLVGYSDLIDSSLLEHTDMVNILLSEAAYLLFVSRMRHPDDRKHVLLGFKSIFGFIPKVDLSPRTLCYSNHLAVVGLALVKVLVRTQPPDHGHHYRTSIDGPLLGGLAKVEECVSHCVGLRWPVLLVGAAGAGKKTVLRHLANISGNVLVEFSATSSTDSTELLGSFEQSDVYRHLRKGMKNLRWAVTLYSNLLRNINNDQRVSDLRSGDNILSQFSFLSSLAMTVEKNESLALEEGQILVVKIRELSSNLMSYLIHFESMEMKSYFQQLSFFVSKVNAHLDKITTLLRSTSSASFEWVDGVVVEAMENGHWLLVDNINLCSASVTDRLNSLLEPSGSLLLTESGDGRLLFPHANFRVFFAMDPVYGEISRAMRNRCAEIAVGVSHYCDLDRHLIDVRNADKPDNEVISVMIMQQHSNESIAVWNNLSEIYCSIAELSELSIGRRSSDLCKHRLFERVSKLFLLERTRNIDMNTAFHNALTAFPSLLQHLSRIKPENQETVSCVPTVSLSLRHIDVSLLSFEVRLTLVVLCCMITLRAETLSSQRCFLSAIESLVHKAEFLMPEDSATVAKAQVEYLRFLCGKFEISSSDMVPFVLAQLVRCTFFLESKTQVAIQSCLGSIHESVAATYVTWCSQAQDAFMNYFANNNSKNDLQEEFLDLYINNDNSFSRNKMEFIQLCTLHSTESAHSTIGISNLFCLSNKSLNVTCDRDVDNCEGNIMIRNFTRHFRRMSLYENMYLNRLIILDAERICSQSVRNMTQVSADSTMNSLYIAALAFDSKKLHSDSAAASVLAAVIAVLRAVDAAVDSVCKIYVTNNECILTENIVSIIRDILSRRDMLSSTLRGSVASLVRLPWEGLIVAVRWIRKGTILLQEGLPVVATDDKHLDNDASAKIRIMFSNILESVDRFQVVVCEYWNSPTLLAKSVLWKIGGHPSVPRLEKDWCLLTTLRSLMSASHGGQSLDLSGFVDSSVAVLNSSSLVRWDQESIQVIDDGLCLLSTFYWAKTNESDQSKEANSDSQNIDFENLIYGIQSKINIVNTRVLVRSLKIDDVTLSSSSAMAFDDYEQKTTLYFDENIRRICQLEEEQAGRIGEVLLIEPVIILSVSFIHSTLCTFLIRKDPLYFVSIKQTLVTVLKTIKCLGIHHSSFDPALFRECQSLLWSVESLTETNLLSKASTDIINSNTLWNSFLTLCRSYVCSFDNRIYTLTSRNFLNVSSAVDMGWASSTLKRLLEGDNSDDVIVRDRTASELSSNSCLKLMQATNMETILKFADSNSVIPQFGSILYNHDIKSGIAVMNVSSCAYARVRYLRLFRINVSMANMSRTLKVHEAEGLSRLKVLDLMVLDILISSKQIFPIEIYDNILKLMNEYLIPSPNVNTCETSPPVLLFYRYILDMNIFDVIIDKYLQNIYHRCLFPVFQLLCMQQVRCSPQLYVKDIGKCWVYVGLLRLRILLPSSPIDPATKSLIKADQIVKEMSSYENQIRAYLLLSSLSGRSLNPPYTQPLVNRIIDMKSKLINLEKKSVHRPSDSAPFSDVYFELRHAIDSLGSTDILFDLIRRCDHNLNIISRDSINNNYNTSSNGSSSNMNANMVESYGKDSTPDALGSLKQCMEEEVNWQQSALAFIERTSASTSILLPYEDIVSPVLSGLQNISFGLRMFVGCCYAEATRSQAASSTTESPELLFSEERQHCMRSIYCNLLQFPYSIRLPIEADSPLALTAIRSVRVVIDNYNYLMQRIQNVVSDQYGNKSIAEPHSSIMESMPYIVVLWSLARLDYFMGIEAIPVNTTVSIYKMLLSKFTQAYHDAQEKKRALAVEKASLYKHKKREQTYESNEAEEEEQDMKLHFPDHLEDFTDIIQTNDNTYQNSTDDRFDQDDESIANEKKSTTSDIENISLAWSSKLDNHSCSALIRFQARMVFIYGAEHMRSMSLLWTRLQRASGIGENIIHNILVDRYDRLHTTLSTYSMLLSRYFADGLRGYLCGDLDEQVRGGALKMLSMLVNTCRAGKSIETTTKNEKSCWSEDGTIDGVDIDMLLILGCQPEYLNADNSACWQASDFHTDPNQEESSRATIPLKQLFSKCSEILVMFPGNELLVQVCKIVYRISQFPLSTPLGKLLASLELLLRKSQEWEQFAASHVSLKKEIHDVASLVSRWRQMELKSWEELLRCKEQTYVNQALKHWCALSRCIESAVCLTTEAPGRASHAAYSRALESISMLKNSLNNGTVVADETKESNDTDEGDLFVPEGIDTGIGSDAVGTKRFCGPSWMNASASTGSIVKDIYVNLNLNESGRKYLKDLFDTMDTFLRSSLVGEFPTRLHIVRMFALQLLQEYVNKSFANDDGSINIIDQYTSSDTKRSDSLITYVGTMLFCIWQYYEQFLSSVRKFQATLRAPLQQKLKDEVKLGKWDELGTYALVEHSERVHRKLNKYLREYQSDVLEYPVTGILFKEIMGGLTSQQGDLVTANTIPALSAMFPFLNSNTFNNLLVMELCGGREADQDIDYSSLDAITEVSETCRVDNEKISKKKEVSTKKSESINVVSTINDAQIKEEKKDNAASYILKWVLEVNQVNDSTSNSSNKKICRNSRLSKFSVLANKMDKYLSELLEVDRISHDLDAQEVVSERKDEERSPKGTIRYGYRVSETCDDLCDAIFERIERLRSGGASRHVKLRAVNDLFRTLKDFGVSTLRSTIPNEMRKMSSLCTVLSPIALEILSDLRWSSRPMDGGKESSDKSNRRNSKLKGEKRCDIDRVERYYIRCVSEINQLRTQAVASFSADVSHRDVQNMLGLSENMFLYVLRARCVLGTGLEDLRSSWIELELLERYGVSKCNVNDIEKVHLYEKGVRLVFDSLLQLQSILTTACTSHRECTFQEDFCFPNIPTNTLQRVEQAVAKSIQHLVTIISPVSDDIISGEERVNFEIQNTLSLKSQRVGGRLRGQDRTMQSHIQFIADHVHSCFQILNENVDDLASLLSWDVVDPVMKRVGELIAMLSSDLNSCSGPSTIPNDQITSNVLLSIDLVTGKEALAQNDGNYETEVDVLLTKCTESCLVTIQRLRAWAEGKEVNRKGCFGEDLNTESTDAEDDYGNIQFTLSSCTAVLSTIDMNKIRNKLSELRQLVCRSVTNDYSTELNLLSKLIRRIIGAYVVLINDLASALSSYGKLLYIVLRIFRNLLAKGVCSVNNQESDNSNDTNAERQFEDNMDGTGMGDGEGIKDVSDQITNEEQLLGLKDENQLENEKGEKPSQKKEPRELGEEEQDQGVEMTQDFDGEICDLPPKKEDMESKEEKDEDQDEDDGEELDRDLGEVNDGDVVDEKQWDGDEGEDPEKEEKFEKDSAMKGEAIEGEMRTKEDTEEEGTKDEEEKGDKQEPKEKPKSTEAGDGKNDHDEEAINEGVEEAMEKPMGVDVRDDESSVGGEDTGNDDGEKGDANENEGMDGDQDVFPDDMKLGGEDENEEGDEKDDGMDVDGMEEEKAGEDTAEDQVEEEGKDEGDDVDETKVPKLFGNDALNELPEDPNNGNEKEKGEENDVDHSKDVPDAAQTPAYGVESRQGKSAINRDDTTLDDGDGEGGTAEEQDVQASSDNVERGSKTGRGGSAGLSGERLNEGAEDESREGGGEKLAPPNPFLSKGDVNKSWHRRLKLSIPETDEEKNVTERTERPNKDENSDGQGLFEYDADVADEAADDVDQVLGPAVDDEEIKQSYLEEEMELAEEENQTRALPEEDKTSAEEDISRKRQRPPSALDGEDGKQANSRKRMEQDSSAMEDNPLDQSESMDTDAEPTDDENKKQKSSSSDAFFNDIQSMNENQSQGTVVANPNLLHDLSATVEDHDMLPGLPIGDLAYTPYVNITASESSRRLWASHRLHAESLSARLCEQLRLVLEPTLASRLHGDYRTGKRISMKRVISYVASGFRKDKIWLRRTKPAKRDYQVKNAYIAKVFMRYIFLIIKCM